MDPSSDSSTAILDPLEAAGLPAMVVDALARPSPKVLINAAAGAALAVACGVSALLYQQCCRGQSLAPALWLVGATCGAGGLAGALRGWSAAALLPLGGAVAAAFGTVSSGLFHTEKMDLARTLTWPAILLSAVVLLTRRDVRVYGAALAERRRRANSSA
jgi:hypothetical protein